MSVSFDVLNSREAAELLGVSMQRVRQLCDAGDLVARKNGRDWMIDLASVRARKKNPPPKHRPPSKSA